MHVPNKEVIQTARTGRPTKDQKGLRFEVRLSESDAEKLAYCEAHIIPKITRGEIVRQGIDRVYQSLLNPEKDAKKEQ